MKGSYETGEPFFFVPNATSPYSIIAAISTPTAPIIVPYNTQQTNPVIPPAMIIIFPNNIKIPVILCFRSGRSGLPAVTYRWIFRQMLYSINPAVRIRTIMLYHSGCVVANFHRGKTRIHAQSAHTANSNNILIIVKKSRP